MDGRREEGNGLLTIHGRSPENVVGDDIRDVAGDVQGECVHHVVEDGVRPRNGCEHDLPCG